MPSPLEALVQGFQENQANQQRQAQQLASQQAADFERQYKLSQAQQEASYQTGHLKILQQQANTGQGRLNETIKYNDAKAAHQKNLEKLKQTGYANALQIQKMKGDTAGQIAVMKETQKTFQGAINNAFTLSQAQEIADEWKHRFAGLPGFTPVQPKAGGYAPEPAEEGAGQQGAQSNYAPPPSVPLPTPGAGIAQPAQPNMGQPTVAPGAPPTAQSPDFGALMSLFDPSSPQAQAGQSAGQVMAGELPPGADNAPVPNDATAPAPWMQALMQAGAFPQPQAGAPSAIGDLVSPKVAAANAANTERASERQADAGLKRAKTLTENASRQGLLDYQKYRTELTQNNADKARAEADAAKYATDHLDVTSTAKLIHQDAETAKILAGIHGEALHDELERAKFSYSKAQDLAKNQVTRDTARTLLKKNLESLTESGIKIDKARLDLSVQQELLDKMLAPGYLEKQKDKDGNPSFSPAEIAVRRQGLLRSSALAAENALRLNAARTAIDRQRENTNEILQNPQGDNGPIQYETTPGGAPKKADPNARSVGAIRSELQANIDKVREANGQKPYTVTDKNVRPLPTWGGSSTTTGGKKPAAPAKKSTGKKPDRLGIR